MKMELNLILNWINFKLNMKMTWIKSFRNPKNKFQEQTKSSLYIYVS
jgi:hypothetical protein